MASATSKTTACVCAFCAAEMAGELIRNQSEKLPVEGACPRLWCRPEFSPIKKGFVSGLEPSSQTLDLTWYRERVSFIRRNTHKYKYKFFSYKKVAPKVAPFFIRWATGGGIVLRAGKKGPWRSASPSCSTLTSARQGIMPPPRI